MDYIAYIVSGLFMIGAITLIVNRIIPNSKETEEEMEEVYKQHKNKQS
jgi:hypothetical protein